MQHMQHMHPHQQFQSHPYNFDDEDRKHKLFNTNMSHDLTYIDFNQENINNDLFDLDK